MRTEAVHGRSGPADERLANALGWFSVGLGIAEVLIPGGLAQLIGIHDNPKTRSVLRTYGLRELAAGAGILGTERPAGWMWARVAGDMLDLASLGKALGSSENDRVRIAAATAAVAGVTALDIACAQQLSSNAQHRWGAAEDGRVTAGKSIFVNRPVEEVYRFWRDFEKFPRFMTRVDSVSASGDGRRSHWKVKAPAGGSVEWDAEIVTDQPNSVIEWRTVEGARVPNNGSVRFERAAGGRGTVVRVRIEYSPPGGAAGAAFAMLFGEDPMQQLDADLRAFKQVMEVGEVVHSDASTHSGMHAAQPSAISERTPEQAMV